MLNKQTFYKSESTDYNCSIYKERKLSLHCKQSLRSFQSLVPPCLAKVIPIYRQLHQAELLEDWEHCQEKQQPKPIAPLE